MVRILLRHWKSIFLGFLAGVDELEVCSMVEIDNRRRLSGPKSEEPESGKSAVCNPKVYS